MKILQASSWIKMSNYGFKLWVQQRSSPKVLIGFDLGLKSTGISITSSDLKHAYYLTTVKGDIASKDFRERITSILLKEKPVGLVLGRPNFVIQAQQTQSVIQAIDEWVKQMSTEHQKTTGLRFTFIDESWTTLTAKAQLIAIQQEIRKWGHLRNQKELLDGMASVAILRKYLQFYNKK